MIDLVNVESNHLGSDKVGANSSDLTQFPWSFKLHLSDLLLLGFRVLQQQASQNDTIVIKYPAKIPSSLARDPKTDSLITRPLQNQHHPRFLVYRGSTPHVGCLLLKGSAYPQPVLQLHNRSEGHLNMSGWYQVGYEAVTMLVLLSRILQSLMNLTICLEDVVLCALVFFYRACSTAFAIAPSPIKFRVNSTPFKMALLGMSILCATAAPVTIDLADFTSGAGVRFHGGAPNTVTGYSVSVIGDHNGDGFEDYIFGARGLRKAVIVMKKNTMYTPMTTESIVSGQYFRVINGPIGSQLGNSVAGIGDVNDDGFADVIISATTGDVSGRPKAGYAFVIFGKVGPFTDITVTATWAASSIGYMILGSGQNGQLGSFTSTTRGLGDVNGDGIDDFAITDRLYQGTSSKTRPGVVWVIFGKKTPAFTTIDLLPANFGNSGVYYTGELDNWNLGFVVMPAGDFNGDGIADFLMGASDADPIVNGTSRPNGGVAYLIHGSKTNLATTDMSTFVTGSKGVRFLGATYVGGGQFGRFLSGVGDINGDGIDDIAIGAGYAEPPVLPVRNNGGIVYVLYGTTVAFTADYDMNGFDFISFVHGFAIYGAAAASQIATVAPAGDINLDGVNDMLVGGVSGYSNVVIVYGQNETRTKAVDFEAAEVTTIKFSIGSYIGWAIDGGKDLNGDGIPDVLFGGYNSFVTPESGGSVISNAGAVWMLPGPFILPTNAPSTEPSMLPSVDPSEAPTYRPSEAPTMNPSASPSFMPSVHPSVDPSFTPTGEPSMAPSLQPTALDPTVFPTTAPSANPSVSPTLLPTSDPSNIPTVRPSVVPSVDPSVTPTALPSLVPSVGPSVSSTVHPTVSPSVVISASPTVALTLPPTVAPSVVPTIRPTDTADKDFVLSVSIQQVVFNIKPEDYSGQSVAFNLTIQHTVADVVESVTPERVTDIVVEEEEEEGGRSSFRNNGVISNAAADGSARLKYKITVYDPLYTVVMLRAILVQAAQEGRMDTALRFYAAQFGATGLNNATLAVPQVTSTVEENSEPSAVLNSWQIALVVIGGVIALCLIVALSLFVACVWYRRPKTKQSRVLPVVQISEE